MLMAATVQLAGVSSSSGDMLLPTCFKYYFDRWPVLTYAPVKYWSIYKNTLKVIVVNMQSYKHDVL